MPDTLTPPLATLAEATAALETIMPQVIARQFNTKEDIHAGLIVASYGASLLPDQLGAQPHALLPGSWLQLVQLILQLVSAGLSGFGGPGAAGS